MRFLSNLGSFINAWRDYPAEDNTVLGSRYTVQEMIGEGSYGIIYQCRDQQSGHVVAVKQSRPSKGDYAKELLNREAAIISSLQHPQIPAYLDFFTDSRHSYLVMSYMDGDTLEDLIFEHGMKYGEVECLHIALQLLELVRYLHEQGYVHLDLRIPNVLFKDGRIHLIDFGLARRIGEPPPLRQPVRKKFPRGSSSSVQYKESKESEDLRDIGHFMLFMLYSAYDPDDDPSAVAERSWQEELQLSEEVREMIKRLLQLSSPYSGSLQFMNELQTLANAKKPPL
ncbi:protein kinase [Paenibacillus sp. BR1-192]|uniref:serine/threonine-protein kinase n=1 Tax=Paenibacillus sp. BR1-192 TaxID=3032287 RepID=UPI00240D1607|nr:protein kinase [Paenibacillus sp. BR1-192]WFB61310.1 protein kinase [Paenibacillus sp. BR1-192]